MKNDKHENIPEFHELLEIFHQKDTGRTSIFSKPPGTFDAFTLADLETNFNDGIYNLDYWRFIKDTKIAFNTIQENYSSRTQVYITAIQCKEIFNTKINLFMKDKGYCCGNWYTVASRSINCSYGRKCIIKNNSPYYRYKLWVYCDTHFKMLPYNNIELNENNIVNKSNFNYCLYVEEEPEEFAECQFCKRLLHSRCVLYLKESGQPFFCDSCYKKNKKLRKFKLTADLIPAAEIDTFIEEYLCDNNVPNADKIVIRLVSNVKKTFKPERMISQYRTDFVDEITYNNCVIFAFYKFPDGTSVCFFAIYFQLYGNKNCPLANRNSVYLSYIDSVKLFSNDTRTLIYQSILHGLFSYFMFHNYKKLYIWSCPPKKNTDYVFYEKPSDMKIPTNQKLIDWYFDLLKKGKEKNVIRSFSTVKKYAQDENWKDLTNIPCFEGDLWHVKLEEIIQDAKKKREKCAKGLPVMLEDIIEDINADMDIQISSFDEEYFVLHLSDQISETIKPEFTEIIKGLWLNDRSEFVDLCHDYKLEFSDKRLAKYSTAVILNNIFHEIDICCNCGQNLKLDKSLLCLHCLRPIILEDIKDAEIIDLTYEHDDDNYDDDVIIDLT